MRSVFRVKLMLPSDYHAPPKGFFLTKIFHPNISKARDLRQHAEEGLEPDPASATCRRRPARPRAARARAPQVPADGEQTRSVLPHAARPSHRALLTPQVVLTINPFPESALNEEAGSSSGDYDAYFKKARMLTEVHALVASKKGEASGSSGELLAETSAGGPVEKKQKPVNSEKREKEKKKSLKRL